VRVAHISRGGPDRVIVVAGIRIGFEDHPTMGPCPVTARGTERRLGPRHPFWGAATQWIAGGRRLNADGVCVWEPEPDPTAGFVHIGGRNWATPTLAAHLSERLASAPTKRDGGR